MRVLRWIGIVLLFVIVALCLVGALTPYFLDRIYYRGVASSHFDGQRFFNPDGEDTARVPGRGGGRAGFLFRQATGNDDRPPWPESVAVKPSVPAARVDGDAMVATWIGHATVLVQTQGLNILTDPIWSERAGPFNLVGPRRVAAPGIRFEDLPKIDLVVVSHNHYDHLDLPTLKRLWDRDKPLIVTSLGNDAVIAQSGAKAVALDWDKRRTVKPGIDVVVTRNHHWGSRWFTDRNRALWSSFTVTLPDGNLFFAGDTGVGDGRWPAEAAKLGPIRLALIPIGAFRFSPGEMGTGSHIGPIDAAAVFDRLGAERAIGIHWGTFRLSYEAYDTPPRLLAQVIRCRGTAPERQFSGVGIGVPQNIPPVTGIAVAPAPSRIEVEKCLADNPTVEALH